MEETAIFTNMVMIEDSEGRVLVQQKVNPKWKGIVFPGGHVESEESFVDSAIREIKEETGLTISNPRLVGVKQFVKPLFRYVVFLFATKEYTGQLQGSREGDVFWLTKEELLQRTNEMPNDFIEMVDVFLNPECSEFYLVQHDKETGVWSKYLK